MHDVKVACRTRTGTLSLAGYFSVPANPAGRRRLSFTAAGRIRYSLKTPWRDGTTHVVFEPLDFLARLAALVPRPRVNLTRFHGVFAPNSRWRSRITPSGRGRRKPTEAARAGPEPRTSMTWARRLKRVFRVDVETCEHCGGTVRIVAAIEDPDVIERILTHIARRDRAANTPHGPRGPPGAACDPSG